MEQARRGRIRRPPGGLDMGLGGFKAPITLTPRSRPGTRGVNQGEIEEKPADLCRLTIRDAPC